MDGLPRHAGQMGLSPASRRKAVAACVRSAATCGSLGRGGGEETNPPEARDTVGMDNDLQKPDNQEAKAVVGAFGPTDQGCLSLESGNPSCRRTAQQPEVTLRTPPRGKPGQRALSARAPTSVLRTVPALGRSGAGRGRGPPPPSAGRLSLSRRKRQPSGERVRPPLHGAPGRTPAQLLALRKGGR